MSKTTLLSCAALGCPNKGKIEGVTFHRFPGDPLHQLKWVSSGRMKVWELSKDSVLCSSHFRAEDIDRTSPYCVQIRDGAVPSVFPVLSQEPGCQEVGTSLASQDQTEVAKDLSRSSSEVTQGMDKLQEPGCQEVGSSHRSQGQAAVAEDLTRSSSETMPAEENSLQVNASESQQQAEETTIYPFVAVALDGSGTPAEDVKPTVCPKCGLVFDERDNINEHSCNDPDFESKVKAVLAFTYPQFAKRLGKKTIANLTNRKTLNQSSLLPDPVVFTCGLCKITFKHKKELMTHEKSHQIPKVYKCEICQKIYHSRQSFRTHLLSHSEVPAVKQFTCGQCGKEFKSKQSMVLHETSHLGIMHKCSVCEKSFTTTRSLATHMLGHSGERPYCCDQCGKTYAQKASLRVHLRSHREDKAFKCTLCEKSFYMSGSLTDHMRVHTNEKPFICETCGKGFAQKTQLTAHQWTHAEVKPLKCSVCEMSFAQRRNLIDHELIHFNLKPFTCDDCGKSYRRKTHLKHHKCKGKRAESLKCSVCDMVFPRRRNLVNHELIHFNIKPFPCEDCGKSYRRKEHLKNHKCKARKLENMVKLETRDDSNGNVTDVVMVLPECVA